MARIVRTSTTSEKSRLLGREVLASSNASVSGSTPVVAAIDSMHMASIAAASLAGERDISHPAGAPVVSKVEQLEQEAKERGYREGYQQGEDAARKKWQAGIDGLARMLEAVAAARTAASMAAVDDTVAIAYEAVIKILGDGARSREAVAEVVESIRQSQGDGGPLVVRVGPEDYEALVVEPEFISLEDERGRIRLVEDSRVALGGCIVETSRGSLDARLDTQLARLRDLLLDARTAVRD